MDTNNMDADSANIAVTNYSESENVCFVCGRNSKASIETTSLTLENRKLFFDCCSKYHWPDPLQKCFQRNLNEQGNNCDLCPDCLSSLEKIREMYQLLEEMQSGIQNFIGLFAKQVLDYQSNSTENHEYIPSKETPDGNSFFENPCLEISPAIDKIEVGPEFEQFEFEAENKDDGIDIKDEPVIQLVEYTNYLENTDTSPSSLMIREEEIEDYLIENDNGDRIETTSSAKGLSLLQEEILIYNNNSTNLGALCPLKNLKIVLKRIQFANEKDASKISNDCAISTGIQQFQCHICHKGFPRKSNLTRHHFIHKRDDDNADFHDENSLPDSNGDKIIVTRGKRKAAETAMKEFGNLERTIVSFSSSEKMETNSGKTSDLDSDSEYCSSLETAKEDDCNGNNEGVKRKVFHCKFCEKNFPRNYSLKRHIHNVHNPRDKIKCKICQKIVQTKYSFDEHLLTHKKPRLHKKFNRMTTLTRYLGNVHKSGNNKTVLGSFECNICRKIFPRKYSLDRHMLIHEKTPFTKQSHQYKMANRFRCTNCKFSCNFIKQLTAHNSETGHLNNEVFKCASCPSVFTKLKDLSNHNLKIHYERMWKCLICPKRFTRRRNLTKHHILHRSNSFKCEICDKTFSRKSFFTRHTSTHTKKLPLYKCTICTKTFEWKFLLDDHLYVHNVGKFKCDTCGKEFLNKSVLHQHRLFHKKIQVKRLNHCCKLLFNKQFKCRICRFTFIRKEHLKKHHLTHKRVWGEILRTRRSRDTTEEEYNKKLTSMNLFECNICQKVFSKWYTLSLKASWKQHRDSAHKNKKYCECETCGKLFYTNEQLQLHKNLYNNEKEIYNCDICKENFHTQFDFDVHKNHPSTNCQKGISYDCGVCDDVFNEITLRNQHFKSHVGIQVACKICEKPVDRNIFMSHWKAHTSAKVYKCDICDLIFDGENKFKIHKIRVHSDERPYKCSICPSAFKSVRNLTQHEEALHMNKKLVCEFCGIVLKSRKRLLEHRQRHINTYYCKLCDKNYTSRYTLLLHNKTVHSKDGKKFQCEFCPKVFSNKRSCESHMRVHTGEKPFACDKCNKKFAKRKQLRNHTSVHSGLKFPCKQCDKILNSQTSLTTHVQHQHGGKIFQCEVCGKKCKRKDNLITHMRSHNGDKPYQCQECGKSFTRLDNLNVHLRWHERSKKLKSVNNDVVENDESENSEED